MTSKNSFQFGLQVGYDTDIGGGRENQDDFLVFSKPSHGVFVACVFDGHGREVGKIAANAARIALQRLCEDTYLDLINAPTEWLVRAHEEAHSFIKESFRKELESQGFEISEDERGGFLLKRKSANQSWTCVHGGSSCSIVTIVGTEMYVANVGDSSGLLCASSPVLNQSCIDYLGDSALSDMSPLKTMREVVVPSVEKTSGHTSSTSQLLQLENNLIVTAEHSPESSYEFYRLREFRPRDGDPTQPSLLVVYDSPSHEKSRCNPVFELTENGVAEVTNLGKYYKNVRKEWASLVSTPITARFQDALAFTRSLGDLHLSSYGVTHLPEVHHISLANAFLSMQATNSQDASLTDSSSAARDSFPLLCLVLATDGVWDNWTYEDVSKFVLDQSCVGAVRADANGAKRVAMSFMTRNGIYAKRNFGSQADNATGIVLYIACNNQIPNGPDFVE